MTIDEAIKILERWKGARLSVGYFDDVRAFQLGIEALKRLKEQRVLEACERNYLLPGETECL